MSGNGAQRESSYDFSGRWDVPTSAVVYQPDLDPASAYREEQEAPGLQLSNLAAAGLVGALHGHEGYPENWGAADYEAALFAQQAVPNDERIDY